MEDFEIPREIDEIAPTPEAVADDMHLLRALKRVSNTFGVTLFIPQLIAAVLMMTMAAAVFLVRVFVLGDTSAPFSTGFMQSNESVWANLATTFVYIAYMFIPFVLQAYFLRENPFRLIPLRSPRNPRAILPALAVVLAAAGAAALATGYIQTFLSFLGLQATSPEGLDLPRSGPAAAVFVLQICVLAPLCEEFLFRGMILQNLRRFGNGFAVVTSSLLFAMVHGDLLQMPLAFLVGLVFGVLAVEFRCIWVTVGMHAAVNILSVVTDGVSRRYGADASQIFYYAVSLAAVGICVLLYRRVRQRVSLREWARRYWKASLPAPFAIKRFFLTPGAILFVLVTGFIALYYMRII